LPGCSNAPSKEDVIYLQERETFYVRQLQDRSQTMEFDQLVGAGMHSVNGKKELFSVKLSDRLPLDAVIIEPLGNPVKTKTIYGDPYSFDWTVDKVRPWTILNFNLTDLPCVVLSSAGSCCGCKDECGGGCSIEYTYRANVNFNPDLWLESSVDAEPRTLELSKPNKINVTFKFLNKNANLESFACLLPKKIEGASLSPGKIPAQTILTDLGRSFELSQKFDSRVEKGSATFEIIITPEQEKELLLTDFARFTANIKTLVYPELQILTNHKIQRAKSSKLIIMKSISFVVS
jgi:hypothetical protein